jgi:NAD(P)H-dependent flavin oxidoreductase YrpB (nitropropane dioxygenase family)
MSVRERLGLERPVVGAGMGGGLSRSRLTIAIASAGGLGQLGIMPAPLLRSELAAHRAASAGPVAVNLLLPFVRPAHVEVAAAADAVVTFWGPPRRVSSGVWLHQSGSVDEALAAVRAGADGVIVQGVEAGGHVRGSLGALALLERVRAVLPAGFPVWLAGGVAAAWDVEVALAAGAEAVVVGTRLLLSEESHAHPEYKRRLVEARSTVLTELFGAGWPGAPHRVVENAATARWLRGDPRGPGWVRALQRASAPAVSRLSLGAAARLARWQRPWSPVLGPAAPTEGDGSPLVDAAPLYAGESVARCSDVRPAAEIVRALSGGRTASARS